MLGREQKTIFQAERSNYCVFGGHGEGRDKIHTYTLTS